MNDHHERPSGDRRARRFVRHVLAPPAAIAALVVSTASAWGQTSRPNEPADDARAHAVLDLVTRYVAPDAWHGNGGRLVTARVADGEPRFSVSRESDEARAVILEANALVERFRPHLFGTAPDDAAAPRDGLRLSPADHALWETLRSTGVTIDLNGASLRWALAEVSRQGGRFRLAVDWAGLEAVGITELTSVSLAADDTSCGRSLKTLLDQCGTGGDRPFAYVSDGMVKATTHAGAERDVTVEMYDARDLAKNDDDARELADRIMELVSPDLWRAFGGTHADLIVIDRRLYVRAEPQTHREVQILLAQLRLALGLPEVEAWLAEARRRQDAAAPTVFGSTRRSMTYDVSDLIEPPLPTKTVPTPPMRRVMRDQLFRTVRQLVASSSWVTRGGDRGMIVEVGDGGLVVIQQEPSAHVAIASLLADMRTLRAERLEKAESP
jgi:hypothetical protein